MEHKFFNMDKEKQDRLINACLKEFSSNGYELASTNNMVKEAGISKGLLFHYFPTKKELYLFLYDYAQEIITRDFYGLIDYSEKDLIKRLRQLVKNKLIILNKYPLLFNFLEKAYYEDAKEVRNEINAKRLQVENDAYKLFSDIAMDKFRDNIDKEKAINIIIWTITGFSNRYINQNNIFNFSNINIEEAMKELEQYFNLFIQLFYKTEESR